MSEAMPPADMPTFAVDDINELRSVIFSADDLVAELVTIPEWNNIELEVRSMTGNERAEYLAYMQAQAPDGDMAKVNWKTLYPSLLRSTVFAPARDAEGRWAAKISDAKVFTEADVAAINAKSAKPIERLARVAQRLSGLNETDEVDE